MIPTLQIGSPLTVSAQTEVESVTSFSKIGYYTNASGVGSTTANAATGGNYDAGFGNTGFNYTIYTGLTGADIDGMDSDFTFFNYDFSAFENTTNSVIDVCLTNRSHTLACGGQEDNQFKGSNSTTASKGLVQFQNGDKNSSFGTGDILIEVLMDHNSTAQTSTPFYADIFSYGDRTNNAIYRLLLEETGDNTATFEGTVEYIMLNQLNVDVASTYNTLDTVSDEIDIIVHEDLTDEDSPRINYFDLGQDGVSTQIADQVEAPSHSGVVTLDMENYKIADTVVVTLDDQDMNTDSELIDVYVTSATDDFVGDGSGTHVLDITFNDQAWTAAASGKTDGSPDDGLFKSGFTIVETGVDSGIFVGSFQIPKTYYDAGSATTVTTTGTDIEVNYQESS